MAVAFDVGSESHTGTTGSVSAGSFSWTHTPVGTPAGVLIYVMQDNDATDKVTSVTYAGLAIPAVSGGFAADTVGEPRACKAFFLGFGITAGAQTVNVNRVNDATVMYAVAITVTAASGTQVYTDGIILQQSDLTLAEQNVDDGSTGVNSVRFAGVSSALNAVPNAGANSTVVQGIDFGTSVARVVRQTTAGQGSLPVGFSAGSSDDTAAVYLAVREASFAIAVIPAAVTLTGQSITVTFKQAVTRGHLRLTGKNVAVFFGTVVPVTSGTAALWGDTAVTWSATGFTWSQATGVSMIYTGSIIAVNKTTAVTPGAVTLTGQAIALSSRTSVTPGVITYDGQDNVAAGGTTFLVEIGAVTLTGQAIAVSLSFAVTPGAMTLAGASVVVPYIISFTHGTITFAGGTFLVTAAGPPPEEPPSNVTSNRIASPELPGLQRLRRHYGLVRR